MKLNGKRRTAVFSALGVAVLLTVLLACGKVYHRFKFPYGQSHCCILAVACALEQFAEENGGRYPAGRPTPEASLGLLYKSNFLDADVLRGMTVPENTVRRLLQTGVELGPDTCGWQYVPDLTRADDPQIAILWCKAALDHFGRRTGDRGRQVVFVGGGVEWIPGDRWPAFAEKQRRLISTRSPRAIAGVPLVSATVEMAGGKEIENINCSFTMTENSSSQGSSGRSTSSGTMSMDTLIWYRAPFQSGSVTRTISFSNLISAPVTVTFNDGIPDKTNIVYEMRTISVQRN